MNVESDRRPFFATSDLPELCRLLAVFGYAGYSAMIAEFAVPSFTDLLAFFGALHLGNGIGVSLEQFTQRLRGKSAVE